jgi:hypothetical protein
MSETPDQPPLRQEGGGSSDAADTETTPHPGPAEADDAEAETRAETETGEHRPENPEEPAPSASTADETFPAHPAAETSPPSGSGSVSAAEPEEAAEALTGESSAPTDAPDGEEAAEAATEPTAGDGESEEAAGDGESEEGESDQAGAGKKRRRKGRGKRRKGGEDVPSVNDVRARIGASTAEALAYVDQPDPRLSRLPRPVREQLIAELPAVTAAALLGPAALARHLVASAASGRYRDLFALWELFSQHPDACKPELSERGEALEAARRNLRLATELGLLGRADRVAEDVASAEGLIWQWLRETLSTHRKAVAERPAVAAAMLAREPDFELPVPEHPSPRWLAEAAAVKEQSGLPEPFERVFRANVHRLPATIATLRLVAQHYPDRVERLLDAVDLDAPDVEAYLAWARDHGQEERLIGRIRDHIHAAAARDRAGGLARWDAWRRRGVELPLPASITEAGLDGLDLTRPETAELAAALEREGHEVGMQQRLEDLASRNRQLAEKAYEAAVCAGLDVTLPEPLHNNPIVKEGTRCPRCQAWTWVRPGHEERCPRGEPAAAATPSPSEAFELAAAETSHGS